MSKKANQNRREDKKAFKKFMVILAVCFVLGGISGFFSAILAENGAARPIGDVLIDILTVISPFANIVIATVLWIVCAAVFKQCKKQLEGWTEEDEETFNRVDLRLSYLMWMLSVAMILNYFFIGAGIYCMERAPIGKTSAILYTILLVGGVFYSLAVIASYQRRIVNLEKELNPEKQGSVYDMNFQKQWMESCDEAERMGIYKCAYYSYRTTQMACLVLFLVCLFGMFLFDFGLMPLTMVIIIWGISACSYFHSAIRIAKHPEELTR